MVFITYLTIVPGNQPAGLDLVPIPENGSVGYAIDRVDTRSPSNPFTIQDGVLFPKALFVDRDEKNLYNS